MADDQTPLVATMNTVRRLERSIRRTESMLLNLQAQAGAQADFSPIVWQSIKNNSTIGQDCPAFGLFQLDSKTVANRLGYHVAVRPSTTFKRDFAVNNPLPVSAQAYGLCATQGADLIVAYDSGTPAYGETWGFKPGQFTASKGFPGLVCRGVFDSTNKWMYADIEPILSLLAKSTATISPGSTTDYKIYVGTAGSEADGGWTTVPSAYYRGTGDIDAGLWCELTWITGHFELKALECNAT